MPIGEMWCAAHGPQTVDDERREGRDFRAYLACGCTRRSLLVHHKGFRWVLPPVPPGYRVATVVDYQPPFFEPSTPGDPAACPAGGAHTWDELGVCDHPVEHARTGRAVRCAVCGLAGHWWDGGYVTRRVRDRASAAASERRRCALNTTATPAQKGAA
jgi:hypothetical protein